MPDRTKGADLKAPKELLSAILLADSFNQVSLGGAKYRLAEQLVAVLLEASMHHNQYDAAFLVTYHMQGISFHLIAALPAYDSGEAEGFAAATECSADQLHSGMAHSIWCRRGMHPLAASLDHACNKPLV